MTAQTDRQTEKGVHEASVGRVSSVKHIGFGEEILCHREAPLLLWHHEASGTPRHDITETPGESLSECALEHLHLGLPLSDTVTNVSFAHGVSFPPLVMEHRPGKDNVRASAHSVSWAMLCALKCSLLRDLLLMPGVRMVAAGKGSPNRSEGGLVAGTDLERLL